MVILTNILFLISTAFLIPIIVLLLLAFVYSLLLLGGFYGLYMNRLKFKQEKKHILERLKQEDVQVVGFDNQGTANRIFSGCLQRLSAVAWHRVHGEKIISDYELRGAKEMEASKTLMRIGPMLGLMGTLIPMGPALVGLASGDIASMAVNMQVAFSTTVVGIFVGAIGFVIQMVKQRWLVEDLNDMQYIFELASGEQ